MDQHFDEAYYQNGSERGTQYRDYLNDVKRNRTYFEIAQNIVEVLRPRRVLEIGCATGAIVSHLRTFDVEAYGIDVSEWAVENRLTDTVLHGTAESLPFEDRYFDLVYSVHALEHLPTEIKDKAFDEIARVCSGSQFHMMPMLESGPYKGDRFGHLLNLRTDPTHSLLYEREWWIQQFNKRGFVDTGIRISMIHDTENYELSDCQILMCRGDVDIDLARRIAEHDHAVAGALSHALNGRPGPGLDVHIKRLREKLAQEFAGQTSVPPAWTSSPRPKASAVSSVDSQTDERGFIAAKLQSQSALIEDLKEDTAELQFLRTRIEEFERLLEAREETIEDLRRELDGRYSELAKLTKALLVHEERAEESKRVADHLLAILRAMVGGGRLWWNHLPLSLRRRRRSRRMKHLGLFDADAYSQQFPDVAAAGYDCFEHYVMHGIDEMRSGQR